MKDLVQEGRDIQKKFNNKVLKEFSLTGEIHTSMTISIGAIHFPEFIPPASINQMKNRVRGIISDVAQKHGATSSGNGDEISIVWTRDLVKSDEESVVMDTFDELKKKIESAINTYLLSFDVHANTFKPNGISWDTLEYVHKIKSWIINVNDEDYLIGDGRVYRDKFRKLMGNDLYPLLSPYDREHYERKVKKLLQSYFKSRPEILVKKIDWFAELEPQLKKLFGV